MRLFRPALVVTLVALCASDAAADATAFIGSASAPDNRTAKGFAVGMGLVVVAFEFEYSSANEVADKGVPSLRTGMGNVLLQTPGALFGVQPYFTVGTGVYRERLETVQETSIGFNSGAGAKISLVGPLRVRVDYRLFKLRGDPLHPTVHRVYIGANVAF